MVEWPLFLPDSAKTVPVRKDGGVGIIGWVTGSLAIVDSDAEADIALLRADMTNAVASTKPHFLKLHLDPVSAGCEVAITVFPLSEEYPVTLTATIAAQMSMHPPADALNLTPHVPYYLLDRPLFHGISGSPVYVRETGDVIAVATSFRTDVAMTPDQRTSAYAALGQAVYLERVRALLDKNHITFVRSEP
jgi:hypothetical protein